MQLNTKQSDDTPALKSSELLYLELQLFSYLCTSMSLNNIYYVARIEICSGFAYLRNKSCLPYGNMLQNGKTNMLIELLFSCHCEFVYLFL